MHRVQKDLKGFSACLASAGVTRHNQALVLYSKMSAMMDQASLKALELPNTEG